MRRAPGALLIHRGQGSPHFDLVIGFGRRCPTLQIRSGRFLRLAWISPHRRAYLTYRGPVSGGRGTVAQRWYGMVRWTRDRCDMGPYGLRFGRKAVVPDAALRTLLRT